MSPALNDTQERYMHPWRNFHRTNFFAISNLSSTTIIDLKFEKGEKAGEVLMVKSAHINIGFQTGTGWSKKLMPRSRRYLEETKLLSKDIITIT